MVFLKKRRGKFVVVCIKWVCHPYVGSAIALPDMYGGQKDINYGMALVRQRFKKHHFLLNRSMTTGASPLWWQP